MSAIERLLELYADYNAIDKARSLMAWDQQVLMPAGGTSARSAQMTILASMAHERLTSEVMRRTIEDAEAEVEQGTAEAAMVRRLRREVDKESKLPKELVERKAKVSSDAYEVWKRAKANSDFAAMRPYYEQLFDINRETAELLGYNDHVYDPLIDIYEEGATFESAKRMFQELKQPLIDLIRRVQAGREVDDSPLKGDWDKPRLRQFAEDAATAIGYDFKRGRLDVAPNAFCMNLSCTDVRMTTRASEHLKGILSSSLHEMGHGLYEQGSPRVWDRTPIAGGVSLAVHESQSRLWENIIGRSRGFWQHFLPSLQAAFPSLSDLSLDEFWRAYCRVEPTYIRVGADELTYNLHILIRFELEVEILTGQTPIKDLPEAWNTKYSDYLGITPPNDGLGCLQDVHWSRGYAGYFPTYVMGNLIGGMIWKQLTSEIEDVEGLMSKGQFKPVLGWLQERVYSQAKLYKPKQLVERVTGEEMHARHWLEYAEAKYSQIYGV